MKIEDAIVGNAIKSKSGRMYEIVDVVQNAIRVSDGSLCQNPYKWLYKKDLFDYKAVGISKVDKEETKILKLGYSNMFELNSLLFELNENGFSWSCLKYGKNLEEFEEDYFFPQSPFSTFLLIDKERTVRPFEESRPAPTMSKLIEYKQRHYSDDYCNMVNPKLRKVKADELFKQEPCVFSLTDEINSELDKISKLFQKKNDQYATSKDDLSNFTLGALLMGQNNDEVGRYEALKSYVMKHIAHVYANNISAPGVKESIGDIAVYFIIALVMIKRNEAKNNE